LILDSSVQKKAILLVEDEIIIAMSEMQQLQHAGYETFHAMNSEQASKIIGTNPIDLILMDIDLGKGKDGTQTAQEILKDYNVPILFLSSHTEPEIVKKTESITNYGYVVKNSSFTVLDASIKMAFKLFAAHSNIQTQKMEIEAAYEELQATNEELEAINEELMGTQQELLDREAALDESEKTFRSLFEKGPFGIAYHRMQYDSSGTAIDYYFLDANNSYQMLTGINPIGMFVSEAFPGIEKDPFNWIGRYGEVARHGKELRFQQHLEVNDQWYDIVAYQNKPDHFVTVFFNITKAKQIETELQNSQFMLEQMFKHSPVPMALVSSSDNVYQHLNSAAAAFLGIHSSNYVGKSLKECHKSWSEMKPDGTILQAEELPMYQALHGNATTNLEIKIQRNDSSITWGLMSGVPIYDKNGSLTAGMIVFPDITEQKLAEEALDDRNIFLTTLLNLLPIGVFMVEAPSGKPILANAMAKFLLGRGILPDATTYNLSEVYKATKITTGLPYPPDEMPIILGIHGTTAHVDDLLVERPDGSTTLLEIFGTPVYDKLGKVKASLVSFMDISERKKSEQILKESETRFRNLVWNMQIGVIMHAPDTRILLSNPKALELLGLTEDQLLSKTSYDPSWNVIHEDGTPFPAPEHPVALAEASRKPVYNITMGVHRPTTNSRVWLSVDAEPVFLPDGSVGYIVVTFIDISQQKQTQENLIRVLQEKEIILTEVHHRIKNNMNTIAALLGLQLRAHENLETKSILQDALGRIQSMMVLYDSLYRSEQNNEISLRVYISALVDKIIDIFPHTTQVTVHTAMDDIRLDSRLLSPLGIIINELITNSMKYAFIHRPTGTINLKSHLQNHHLIIVYSDDGVGIPDAATPENPSGFGMQLVNLLIRQMHGTLVVERKAGTTFTINIDLAAIE